MASERRLHPLSFLFAIQDSAKQFLLPVIVGLFAARSRDAWEVWTALIVVPLALAALGRALSFRYRFEPTELVIRSGFVFRRVRHIPYDRIQNVDAVQNVMHRAFGVIEVRVETGGGAETEAVLRVVDRAALDEIRGMVFAERARPSQEDAAAMPQHVLLAMPAREVLLFGLVYGRGTIVAGALFGLLWELGIIGRTGGNVFGAGDPGGSAVRQMLRGIFDDGAMPMEQLFTTSLVILVLIGLFRLVSAIWTFLSYYGFRVTRSGDDLRCEYGFLTRVASTIPVRRIQTVTVREGPWHRLGNRVSVGVQTAGGKAGEANGSTRSWLAPLVHRSAMAELLSGIVAEASVDVDWQAVHPRGVRRELAGSMFLVIPACAVLWLTVGPWALVAFPVLAAVTFVHARRSVAALRWAVASDTVQFASGWIWRRRVVAPLAKIQVVTRDESPFDRRHGMATVFADTAGRAQGDHAIRIPYLASNVAVSLAQRLAAAASRTSFRW